MCSARARASWSTRSWGAAAYGLYGFSPSSFATLLDLRYYAMRLDIVDGPLVVAEAELRLHAQVAASVFAFDAAYDLHGRRGCRGACVNLSHASAACGRP